MTRVLSIRQISLTYPGADVPAVDTIDLDIGANEILALVGESGCGKSSTLRMIAGLEYPDDGEIRYGKRVLNRPGYAVPPEKRSIGMVFQDNALFPHLTVEENIAFGCSGDGRDRAREMIALTGLQGLEKRYPHQISGGQMQRAALARALAPAPDLLLMDEPFNNLDIRIKRGLLREIGAILRATHTSCLFITHEKDEAYILADRIAVMREGRLLQTDKPAEIYARPATTYVAEFFGRANLLPVSCTDSGFATPFGRYSYPPGSDRGDYPATGYLIHRPWDVVLDAADGFEAEIIEVYFFGDYQEVRFRPAHATAETEKSYKFFTRSAELLAAGGKIRLSVPGEKLCFTRE